MNQRAIPQKCIFDLVTLIYDLDLRTWPRHLFTWPTCRNSGPCVCLARRVVTHRKMSKLFHLSLTRGVMTGMSLCTFYPCTLFNMTSMKYSFVHQVACSLIRLSIGPHKNMPRALRNPWVDCVYWAFFFLVLFSLGSVVEGIRSYLAVCLCQCWRLRSKIILRFYLSMAGEMLVRPSVHTSVRKQITYCIQADYLVYFDLLKPILGLFGHY